MNDDSFLTSIYSSIETAMSDLSNPTAVFDADGTLWSNDVGVEFFQYQIKNQLVTEDEFTKTFPKLHAPSAPFHCDDRIMKKNKGASLKQYRSWCRNFLDEHSLFLFSFQKQLLQFLKEKGVTLWVVSASCEWLVEEALQCYQLPIDHVIGAKAHLEDGVITDQIRLPLSKGVGKKELFLQQNRNAPPFLVSGNTLSDLEILNISTHFRLVVSSAKKGERQYEKEQALLEIARTKSWFYKTI